ncbi:predicted nucleotide kinase, related to CMP and AMP kinases [Thermococcus kodakarensis KOD1]|uniref:Putative adenylate kinase n=1 Tax=Thermococcus kodakarensis (strain ATCC BAA-918 / JCM 12380 / KOD1) TaxID=69014 RepID=KAD6_THEKO|nr:adenylate kinase family protein [Thermococcus kodakarensis]Q5JG26.1 RecName: Full=Putative adenylate kinase; Short=AK; AltName: Full=ATP-AMP transphosphorylase [Thermococcus kodakarensis KOD1]WCN28412.1 adenylate kinase family protein [Thermococcus kodakarensis]WCN30708.1 adenylate kinase family protein [Thermococcus kodakarensis]BAD84527.1 predicted nucleotide kinase, related to CMP and AMP kinases [Thermococcus kodakarensis KOD1]
MIIAVTGTPGVGKTTISKLLAEKLGYEYVNLRDYALEKGIGEMKENELEIDVDELREAFGRDFKGKNVVADGHLSHFLKADLVIVLRANPKLIAERLKERGYGREKLGENVEAELVDVILVEALEENENVIEVDTTGKTPEEVVEEILNLIRRGVKRRVGIVDWSEVYDEVLPYLRL